MRDNANVFYLHQQEKKKESQSTIISTSDSVLFLEVIRRMKRTFYGVTGEGLEFVDFKLSVRDGMLKRMSAQIAMQADSSDFVL